jgi:hypothetical protein
MKSKLLFIPLLFLFSCKIKPTPEDSNWSKAGFDSTIKFNPIFQSLHGSPETIVANENLSRKDTCGIAYIDEHTEENSFNPSEYFPCYAYLLSDTLRIDISINILIGGYGFIITYTDRKFFTRPFMWVHNDINREAVMHKIIKQNLILDKTEYISGDSLYGKIYFHNVEDQKERKIEHHTQGIFRAKVKNPEYIWVNGKKVSLIDIFTYESNCYNFPTLLKLPLFLRSHKGILFIS